MRRLRRFLATLFSAAYQACVQSQIYIQESPKLDARVCVQTQIKVQVSHGLDARACVQSRSLLRCQIDWTHVSRRMKLVSYVAVWFGRTPPGEHGVLDIAFSELP